MASSVPSGGINNLVTLIKRLEAATSRLEDMATSIDSSHPATIDAINQAAATPSQTSLTSAPKPAPTPEPLPRSIEEFDRLIEEEVGSFVTAAEKIDPLLFEQAKSFREAFKAERTYLLVATKSKQPSEQQELLTDLHHATGAVDEKREANRASPYFPHLSAVSEGVVALGWIVEKRPADLVAETFGGAQFYGNRVLKEYKEKDQKHVEYIQAFYKVFRSLIAYIKEHHALGLVWNNKDGIDAMEALKQVKGGKSTGSAGGAPPPPPPPPPLPTFDNAGGPPPPPPPPAAAAKGGDMGAVFDQINQGSGITASLRKVDKSEMTHKNPSLRAGSAVPERSSSVSSSTSRGKSPMPSKKPKPESMRTKKPPKKELEGSKWLIENFENTGTDIIEVNAEISHGILISRCTKAVVKVNGKANAISIDNCTGLSIVIDSLVSSLDVIKSPKFQVQVDGVLPTVLLDQVDGAQIYLSPKSLGTEVFTSKCSSVNIVLPPSDDNDGDDKECPVPEQIRTVVKDGKVVSEIVEHAG
ncbi:putative adenylyl cyclase-associated protein [Phaeomoniella chlamydospora]|uniref:Adenylyl cyclase-associated protein n=1 Tax=Phaeomoniella chlamydospora TaxID=158046 RepID=A0A0G2EGA9_PHACM|nr:putative adenylyl cyclase-associated protein [Phaeomoniella chlamydospora]